MPQQEYQLFSTLILNAFPLLVCLFITFFGRFFDDLLRICHWRIGLAPRFFDLGRGELVFFRRFPFFFEQNPTLNRKKSFRCAKGRAFSFFFGPKKVFFEPKKG